jgi:hypothetical protein
MSSDYTNNFDLMWNKLPLNWEEGAFLGNGRQGVMIWANSDNEMRFDIGDSRIYKNKSRTPIGKFIFRFSESIVDFNMHQFLSRSEVQANIKTQNGNYNFNTIVDANSNLVRVIINSKDIDNLSIEHIPLPGIESDILRKSIMQFAKENGIHNVVDFTHPELYEQIYKSELVKNLPSENVGERVDIHYRIVPFDTNSGYILLWNIQKKVNKTIFNYTTHYYRNIVDGDLNQVIGEFKMSVEKPYNKVLKDHYAVWGEYFNEPYISLPDKKIEANFWIQLYKMRAATREGELPIDLLGPWYRATPWPRIWTNLNLQITYPVMNQSNKYSVARTLFDYMDENQNHFIQAVGEEFRADGASVGRGWAPYEGTKFWGEYGNFLWILHNYSQFLKYFPDESRLEEVYYPLLKRGVNFVIRNLYVDENGVYHVPADISPEYKVNGIIPEIVDNSYNLGLLQWALSEAVYLSKKYNDISGETEKYEYIQQNLAPIYIDEETGIMVGKGYKMDVCHRHFSHLIAFYPLSVLDISNPNVHALCLKSLEHWISRPLSDWGFKGYTYTSAAAMYARLGKGEKALESLDKYLNDFSTPNTFYIETGPVIETTMHSVSATLEILLQSRTNIDESVEIKLFPAMPKSWDDANFSGLRTEGGFIVSGSYENGEVVGASIESIQERKISIVIQGEENLDYKTTLGSFFNSETVKGNTIIKGSLQKGEMLFIGKTSSHSDHRKVVAVEGQTDFHFGIN